MQHDMQFGFRTGNWMDGMPCRVMKPIGAGGLGEEYEVDTRERAPVVR